MNFFGHAVVAALEDDRPRFVLGAMLPDLCSMAGLQLKRADEEVLAAGVAQHHRVDRAFHGCAPFVSACGHALSTLEPLGVARGAARAVGHIGSELLLDGALAHRSHARAAYADALALACEGGALDELVFRDDTHRHVLEMVVQRLAKAPIPDRYREPVFVHERLAVILSRRPRLALSDGDHGKVLAWLEHVAEPLSAEAEGIVSLLDAARHVPLP